MSAKTSVEDSPAVHVIKVGGSIIDSPTWLARLPGFLPEISQGDLLLIAGGGELADQVRLLDSRYALAPTAAHWMAIRAMRINARILWAYTCNGIWTDDIWSVTKACHDRRSPRHYVLDPWRFMTDWEPTLPGVPLPIGWQVTSDSIAARVATTIAARNLTLLKRCDAQDESLSAWADAGLVDQWFPSAAAQIGQVDVVRYPPGGSLG